MHVVHRSHPTHRLVGRDGHAYAYPSLDRLCAALKEGGFLRMGMLSADIQGGFESFQRAEGGPFIPVGIYVVEGPEGERLTRDEVEQACWAWGKARRKRTAWRRYRNDRPRKRHASTKAGRRQALADLLDLAEIDPGLVTLVPPMRGLDCPYERGPIRRPQRSWKSHRKTRWL